MKLKQVITSDGSHTLYNPLFGDHFHSTFGAIQESNYIFVDHGLKACLKNEINIFEMGFGTGLNALLTLIYVIEKGISVNYHAVELYPLTKALYTSLNYTRILGGDSGLYFKTLHEAPWNKQQTIATGFSLKKERTDFTTFRFEKSDHYDLIFYDAFAPDKQPQLWEEEIFPKIFEATKANGIFITYCAKGSVRRGLSNAGFQMERVPGPPGKHEILRGRKE